MINCSNIVQIIAENTKIEKETITEAFCLNNQHLLISKNNKHILFPIFNTDKPIEILNNVLLAAYLKTKYNSKIVLVLNKKNKNNFIYELFKQYFSIIIYKKRYFELNLLCNKYNITKLVYNKQPLPSDLTEYIDFINIEFKTIKLGEDNDTFYKETIVNLDLIKRQKDNIFVIDHTKNYEYNIQNIFMSLNYLANDESIYNYIVPFLGMKITTTLDVYNNSVFDFSDSKRSSLIKKL